MARTVLFTGRKTQKYILGVGPVTFQAVAFEENRQLFLGFTCTNSTGELWSFEDQGPLNDPILLWRGLQFLDAADHFGVDIVFYALLAGSRTSATPLAKIAAAVIQRSIGVERYWNIMRLPIPDQVITIFIHMVESGFYRDDELHLYLEVISSEIDKTISWSVWGGRLSRLGVIHRNVTNAYNAARAKLLARYWKAMNAYATYLKTAVYQEPTFRSVQAYIVLFTEQGVEKTYGPDIVLGAAIAHAFTAIDAVSAAYMARHNQWYRAKPIEYYIQQVTPWLLLYFRQYGRTQLQYEELLLLLHNSVETSSKTISLI